jgi:myo-inositol-1(or 4)-monophosphatase
MNAKESLALEKFIKDIIVKAGKQTLKYYGKAKVKYTKENESDFVTEADLASNRMIVNSIRKKYPSHGIISEEEPVQKQDKEYVWILDPIDGTYSYAHKSPMYGVMIAITKDSHVIMASIYLPYFDELYFARKNKGAYLNGKRVRCSQKKDMRNSIGVGTLVPLGERKRQIERFFAKSTQKYWLTSTAAIANDTADVARGVRDWFFSPHLWDGIWDFAAPSLILEESGCKVTDFDGNDWNLKSGSEFIAANPILHNKIMKIINR